LNLPPVDLTEIEHAVLRYIRLHPGKSRTEIATDLGLSKSMLTKAVAKFGLAGLVTEEQSELHDGERGKPPIRLSLRASAFCSVGLYLDNRYLAIVLTDLVGNVLHRLLLHLDGDSGNMIAFVLQGLEQVISEAPAAVLGIGLAVPAIVDDHGNLFEVTPTQAWLPFADIATAIRSRFNLPVYWENDAYCQAAYEANGPHAHRRCVFYISFGFGVGGGMVVDGTIFRGAFNQAANIGALIPETGPRPSLTDLAKYLDRPMEQLLEHDLLAMLRSRDSALLNWIADRGKRMSDPLSAAIQFFNPDALVIGGFFPREMLAAICEYVDLGRYDIIIRRPVTKPALQLSILSGPSGIAEAAAHLPIAYQLLGRQTIKIGD
jgi:predicted NBD/HSP70 family sugar kinase